MATQELLKQTCVVWNPQCLCT